MNTFPIRVPLLASALILLGVAMLLQRLHVVHVGWQTVVWSVVALAGALKIVNGIALRQRGRVFWGLMFLGVGVFALLHRLDILDPSPGPVLGGLLLWVGTGFLLMFVVVPRDWYVLVPAFFFLLSGSAVLSEELGYREQWDIAPLIASFWPVALIAFGIALLLNSRSLSR